MRTADRTRSRRVSEPVERARVEALLDRGVKVPGAYLAAARVASDRSQKKLRIFDERQHARIVVDFAGLQRDHPGSLIRFQLRELGQVLGTAQWHIPAAQEEEPAAAHTPAPSAADPTILAATAAEALRLREELAGVRGEARHLAEEARRLRSELGCEQAARHRAEADRDAAREAAERGRERCDALREKLNEAGLEQKESLLAFRLLRDRFPQDVKEVYRLVSGDRGDDE